MKNESHDLMSYTDEGNSSSVDKKSSPQPNGIRNVILLGLAIIAVTLAVYWQVGGHDFIDFDDADYVTANPHVATGITGPNIVWAFTSAHSSNWHPITWVSLMTDAQLYGIDPRGYHLTNVCIHAVSALLLLLLLFKLTSCIWQSSFVAALFALHPLHVESVAWVAERKDVLSAFFLFLTLLIYASYVAKKKKSLYLLTLFSFVLGLMSKPMLVTLPIVMLLLDFWPLNRYDLNEQQREGHQRPGSLLLSLLKEKIPFFVCSLLSAVVTVFAQHSGKAMNRVPFDLGIKNTILVYVKYIIKAVWPRDLAIFYPLPASIPHWQVICALLAIILVSAAIIRSRRQNPFLVVGWFWYLATLIPVVGIIPVGEQSMADRYTYIPLVGIFIMIAWGAPILTRNLHCRKGILTALAGAVILVSTVCTWRQIGYWRDSISLFRHAILVTPSNPTIHNMMGHALANKGDLDSAIMEFKVALGINPEYTKAQINLISVHNYLGNDFAVKGNLDAAIKEFREVLALTPNSIDAHNNLGITLARKGDMEAAIKEFQEALTINPNSLEARNNLDLALAKRGAR